MKCTIIMEKVREVELGRKTVSNGLNLSREVQLRANITKREYGDFKCNTNFKKTNKKSLPAASTPPSHLPEQVDVVSNCSNSL